MTEGRVGSWIVDLSARTATEGELVVTVVSETDGTYSVHFFGNFPVKEQIQIGREALEVFDRAHLISRWQNTP